MKKKQINMITSLLLLVVLCGAYYGIKNYAARQEEAENAEEEEDTEITIVSADDVSKVSFMIDKKEVVFAKEEDSWVIEDNEDFPVDQTVLDDAVSVFADMTADREIDNAEDLEQYGLNSPDNTITIENEENEKTVLRVGIKNDSTSQYYVNKDEDKNTVYVVAESEISPFMDSLYDYAEKEDFPYVNSSSITRIALEKQDTSYELEDNEDTGLWDIRNEEDASEKADTAKVSALTSSVSALAYDSFIEYNCQDDSIYGLDNPYATLTVDYEETIESDDSDDLDDNDESGDSDESNDSDESDDGDASDGSDDSEAEDSETTVEKQLILYVGDQTENNARYVRLEGSTQVYTIDDESISTIVDKSFTDYLDLTVNYLSVNQLDELSVTVDGEDYEFNVSRETSENDDGEETETLSYQMNDQDIDSIDFTTFYNKMINMTAQERFLDEYEPENAAEMKAVFKDTDGNEKTVEYYEYDTNYYAAVIEDRVYLINKMSFRELLSSFETVIEKEESADEDEEAATTEDADGGNEF